MGVFTKYFKLDFAVLRTTSLLILVNQLENNNGINELFI
jgi:hypothetical protein